MRFRITLAKAIGPGLLMILALLCPTQCSRPGDAPIVWPQKEIGVSEKAASDLVARLSQIPQDGEVLSAILTDEELTSYARIYVADASLHEPTILIAQQGLYLGARVGRRAQHQVRALFTVKADHRALRINIVGATVDDRAVPRLVLRCLEQVANAILADTAWPIQVKQVILGEGALTIEGAPRSISVK